MTRKSDGKRKEMVSSLSPSCDLMCSLADSSLMGLKQRIIDGSISMEEMMKIYEKKHQVEKLCDARQDKFVKDFMEHRNDECTAFRQHKKRLTSFFNEIKKIERLDIKG